MLFKEIHQLITYFRSIGFILMFASLSISTFAQNNQREIINKKIQACVVIDAKKLSDSAGFYGLAIRIELMKTKGKTIVEKIVVNDSLGNAIIKNYEGLKKLDYSSLVPSQGKSILVLPISVLVVNYSSKKIDGHKISLDMLIPKINKLFDYDPLRKNAVEGYIYLSPLLISIDKTVYN
ncbi:hypothetical protein ACTJKC_22165 [Pedobacter sp. 22226]|uniref:hypothetical protein n=1 Tax=Pedobacter sp. 22226 TaxID=3453894 RepID=UPI003F8525D0